MITRACRSWDGGGNVKPLDIDAMLRRGGQMSQAEAEQLAGELTAGKLLQMSNGIK